MGGSAIALELHAGRDADLAALNELYNHYVRETPITFDLEPIQVERRRVWFAQFAPESRHQLWVATEADRLLGYACSHPFRPKAAYASSVETTVYCAPDAIGQGVGRKLYAALFDGISNTGLHRAYAGVTQPNPASMALHRAFGFRELATYTEVGHKFGRYWDVLWLEKAF